MGEARGKTETVRVPDWFKAELDKHVKNNGMTHTGVFRVHGKSILKLIQKRKSVAQQTGAT